MTETAVCPACGQSNDFAQRFCGQCGSALGRVCAKCGTDNPPGFRFCGACGAALDAGASSPVSPSDGVSAGGVSASGGVSGSDGERRWVTVLFADLSGFTALSEHADPEDVRAMVDRRMSEMGEVVERFGGSVDKVMGDALMAVFGAPLAHEDDAERAVRAALEIQSRASTHLDDFSGLRVSVGVNTGEVMFARVGPDSRREMTVMGDVVNTAARLQGAAAPGAILVGEQTHAASARAISYDAAQPISAKGKEQPLPVWLARAATSSPADRPISATPFVGRDAELELLQRTWNRVRNESQPQLVTIVGPAGMGKTRLTLEFSAHVHGSGGRTLRGRPLPYGERTAYWALAQVIRDAAAILATDSADIASGKLHDRVASLFAESESNELAAHLSILARLAEDTAEDRQALFVSAQRFLEALALEQPTVLVLEDLHCADDSLLELVEGLPSRMADVPLFVVALARPEFLDARPSWARVPTNVTVQLQALTDGCAGDLVRLLLSDGPDREAVVKRVEEAAAGNPLFIEELAAWGSEGDARDSAGAPTNVKTIIAARLDQLPAPERQVILDASVVGDFFWQGTLEALGSGDRIADALVALERRGLLRRSPTSRIGGDQELVFKHSLVREVAYDTLPKAARRERHEVVARFIEQSAGDPAPYAAVLAHHWREAGDAAHAADWLITAADQAGRGWAPREAIELCNQALALIPEDDAERRRRARLRRAVLATAELHATVDLPPGSDQSKSAGEMSPPIS